MGVQGLHGRWIRDAGVRAGGRRIPVLHDGKVYAGSDWIPQDRSINPLATNRGLVVRYPVRMKEDLLPYTKITTSELRNCWPRT